jgi:arylsulfatase A-like enzyme
VLETGPSDRARAAELGRAAVSVRPPRARPNVLLLGVDSLRPDKIDARTTPALARLVGESIFFPNTLVTLPRTAPSWVALLTSLPPLANGVETMFPGPERSRLAELAMPAHLASLGYATQVSSEYAGEFFDRVSLGFERVSVPRVELEQILGQALLGRQPAALAFAGQLYAGARPLRRLLPAPVPDLLRGFASFSQPSVLEEDLFAGLDAKRPWFALLFYSQPHFPYTSSSPFYERFAVGGSDASLRFGKDVTRGDVRTAADRAQIEALYRGALAETDAAVGDLLDRLAANGELDDTIVVVTSDHGEGLYECASCVGHGDNLVGMMTLRVPLAFRLPPRRYPAATPGVVDSYVSQLDVYPTLESLLGVPPLPIHEGVALLSTDGGRPEMPLARTFFAETGEWLWPTPAVPSERLDYPPITALASVERDRIVIEERFLPVIRAAKHRAAIMPPWKLVYRPGRAGVAWSLYDIEKDPFEATDLASSRPDVFAALKASLVRSVLRFPHMVSVEDHFLTRPPGPPEEYY